MSWEFDVKALKRRVLQKNWRPLYGKVSEVIGLTLVVKGVRAAVGEVCRIETGADTRYAEVVGFKGDKLYLMPLGDLYGIGPEALLTPTGSKLSIKAGTGLRGRVLDGIGRPLTGGALKNVPDTIPLLAAPPNPLDRRPIDSVMETGVKAIDGLLTCGYGQRMGIFAGSGVGKSTLLGMIAKNSSADINVIGLIGERGREVKEFIANNLGSRGLEKSVVVVSTSDQPALQRIKAAYTATAIAEYYRERGLHVLLLVDSLTRFATAQRELGLAIGEPPTTRGFPPSVFAQLPQLLERSGTSKSGSITAFYTVLVDGDDMNEPIADTVRGIVDGHIVLSRQLAERNHFPAIDVLQSISRLMPEIVNEEHMELASKARNILSAWRENEDLIAIGAYKTGANQEIDTAIAKHPQLQRILRQDDGQGSSLEDVLQQLAAL